MSANPETANQKQPDPYGKAKLGCLGCLSFILLIIVSVSLLAYRTTKRKDLGTPFVEAVLVDMQKEDFAHIYAESDAAYKSVMKEDRHTLMLRTMLKRTGKLKSWKIRNWMVRSFNGVQTIDFVYDLTFDTGPGVGSFTIRRQAETDTYRLQGWNVNSDALLLDPTLMPTEPATADDEETSAPL